MGETFLLLDFVLRALRFAVLTSADCCLQFLVCGVTSAGCCAVFPLALLLAPASKLTAHPRRWDERGCRPASRLPSFSFQLPEYLKAFVLSIKITLIIDTLFAAFS
jgi:hypothetical protein